MGQALKDLDPAQSPLHYFGAEVRRRRQDIGLSQADLGALLFVHKDLVRKVEAAERVPSQDLVERCDEVLDGHGDLVRLWPLLRRERLLRLGRDGASPVGVYQSEALDRPVLDWLLASELGQRERCGNLDTARAAGKVLGQLRGDDHARGAGDVYPAVVNALGHDLEALSAQAPRVAAGFLELAGYEAVDLGADGLAQQHYLQALDLVTRSGDRLYGGYLIAVSLAHLALHCGDAQQARRLVAAGLRGVEDMAPPAVLAAIHAVLARTHARLGDHAACASALSQADTELHRRDPAEEPAWIAYFGEADLADEKAHCFLDLNLHQSAQREVVTALGLLNPQRVRRLAIDTALHATSLARSGQIEPACAVGRLAVAHAARLSSFRSWHRIVMLLAELQPHADLPPVRDLAEVARETVPLVAVSPAVS